MHFGARAHSLDDVEFLARAGFAFAEIDFAAILRDLRAAGYDGGFSFEVKLEHVERGRDTIREIWRSG